jgi:hypothetical protein
VVVELGGAATQVCARTAGGAAWCWGELPGRDTRRAQRLVDRGVARFFHNYGIPAHVCFVTMYGSWRCLTEDGTLEPVWPQRVAEESRNPGDAVPMKPAIP